MSKVLVNEYLGKDIPVIPVPYKSKAPNISGWPDLVITSDNVDQYFYDAPQNISVLLGKEGSNYIDLDLDCAEAVIFAKKFAPQTGFCYGRVSNPSSHWLYKSLDGNDTAKFEHPDHGVFLEIRGSGHASLLPGSVHPEGETYELSNEGVASSVAYGSLYKAAALIASCSLMSKYWPAKGMRQQCALTYSGLLVKAGYNKEEVATAVFEVAKLAGDEEADKRKSAAYDTAGKHEKGIAVSGITALREMLPESVSKCLSKWLEFSPSDEINELVEKLNEKYAFIVVGGTQRILSFKTNPTSGEAYIAFIKLDAFKGLYKNETIIIGSNRNGPIEKTLAEIWLSHPLRRTYEDMVFEPGQTLPPNIYNYWQGFAVNPKEDDALCEPFFNHLYNVVCNENEHYFLWLVSWLAHMVQHPEKKPGTAVVLIGPQGAGKTCVAEYIGEMFKPHFLKINNPKHLLGNFNAHQDGIVFALCEEAFLAGDKAAQGVLKDMITSDSMMIERKGIDSVRARNCLHLLLTSNNSWVVSADIDDRRFFVLEVSGKRANDYEYFAEFKQSQNNGGPAALLNFLLKFDYNQVELRKPPHTEALVKQKLQALEPIGKVLHKFLSQGHIHPKSKEWPEWIETNQMCEICFVGTKKVGVADKGLQTKLGMLLPTYIGQLKKEKKYLPEVDIETGEAYPIAIGSGKVQQIIYILPPLEECRSRFTARTGIPFLDETEN